MQAWMDKSAAGVAKGEELGVGGDGRISDEDLRHFRIGIDVRSFKANLRLQMRAVNVYVRVLMPQQLVNLGLASRVPGSVSKLTTPHRTHPPVAIHRGMEVAIPNGYVALEFPAFVGNMASALAQKPQLVAQVLHSDRFTTDSLLGTASIPLVQLMHQPVLDGFAPVISQSANAGGEADQCVIGALRVVLSMEDLGPVRTNQEKAQKSSKQSGSHLQKSGAGGSFDNFFESLKTEYSNGVKQSNREDTQNPQVDHHGVGIAQSVHPPVGSTRIPFQEDFPREDTQQGSNGPIESSFNDDYMPPNLAADLHKHPAFELAWEFEMWRRSEEAKWRQNLQEKELEALSNLESNWLKKENEMVYQIQKIQDDNIGLEQKLRAKLMQLEKREKALVLAEEHFSLRREALERSLLQHNTDAKAAMKRIQADCEHRLELGQQKYVALEDQYKALEKRFSSTNASLLKLEKQFSELKAAYRNTSEACLTAKVVSLQQQCSDLQQKLDSLVLTRSKYKEQLLRMAKELASLQHLKFREEAKRVGDNGEEEDVRYVAALVEEHAKRSEEERQELRQLKEQLQSLELTGVAGEPMTLSLKQESNPDQVSVEVRKQDLNERIDEHVKQDSTVEESAPTSSIGRAQEKGRAGSEEVDAELNGLSLEESLGGASGVLDNGFQVERSVRASEAQKLAMHKLNLLSSGLYAASDTVILGLDREILKLRSDTKTSMA
ncbi:hypothetical protein R1sor_013169 [Riccia sorocarpa]|uniref:Uncharacterized protein n=1 Tax=Riccia sorocarpa TaxID=122646 RepID=A0ABD3H924_9MARC